MTIAREKIGEIVYRIYVYRDGKLVTNPEGEANIADFIIGIEVVESITSATIEIKLVVQDAAGAIGAFTGSEQLKIQLVSPIIDRTYFVRSYEIVSRVRDTSGQDMFMLNCCSDEFVKNEINNVFGHSHVVFGGKTESSEIVKQVLQDKRFLQSKKNIFLEETINKQQFVATNWRPFDAIYWLAQRSIRKAKKGGNLQNGFCFWENALGYNFQSIDKMIADVNDQKETKSNWKKGEAQLYTYTYSQKNTEESGDDQFRIESLVFPEERNFLSGLRHGTWSGFSVGFDPVTITSSKFGLSTDMSVDAYRYGIKELWPTMEHLNSKKTKNPIAFMDSQIQTMTDYPKRVRYSAMSNQIFDQKYKNNPQKNYEELVELQAYQYMRIESIKNFKLLITVPGNLDLYAGKGVNLVVPGTFKSPGRMQIDKRYSGRYLIASVAHKIAGGNQHKTELVLLKDSILPPNAG